MSLRGATSVRQSVLKKTRII